MIFVKIFLAQIFLKIAPTCARGSIVYPKSKTKSVRALKWVGIIKNDKKSLLVWLLKSNEPILQHFYMLNFQILSQEFDFFIIPGVSRTFDPVL